MSSSPPPEPAAPTDFGSFCDWAAQKWGKDPPEFEHWYEANARAAKAEIEESELFRSLSDKLPAFAAEESRHIGHEFLMRHQRLELQLKPFESALDKALRLNVLGNPDFPAPPSEGWVQPTDWFRAFEDIIRGQIFCRFVDGPQRTAEFLASLAEERGLEARIVTRQHERGYYSASPPRADSADPQR